MRISRSSLPGKRLWKPFYGRYSRDIMMRRLQALEDAGVDTDKLRATRQFVSDAYDYYQGIKKSPHYGFVFAIPTRISRRGHHDVSEAQYFLPIVDEVATDVTQVIMSELPPVVLDEYHDKQGRAVGAVLFVPIFSDIAVDVRPRLRAKLKVDKIMKDASLFVRKQLQAEIMGLGATLPKLTKFGKTVSRHGLVATTGHAGTVYLIYKEFAAIVPKDFAGVVGVVGAGSISASSAAMILDAYPKAHVCIYDIRSTVLRAVVKDLCDRYDQRASAAQSNDEVLRRAGIVISAITAKISIADNIDLSGKVIIDDSQPGSFDKQQVESRGGSLVWVVGHDNSKDRVLTRRSSFRYGDEGLCDAGDVWGCEAEVAALWLSHNTHLAVNEQVDPDKVRAIGAVMDVVGIGRAAWQVAGQKVSLKTKQVR